jgi:hypothetical protein
MWDEPQADSAADDGAGADADVGADG